MDMYYWIALLFSITLIASFLGYQPVLFDAMQKYSACQGTGANCFTVLADTIGQGLINWNSAIVVLALGASILMSGLNLIALIPFGLLYVLVDLLTFPSSLITESGLPSEVTIPITLFFSLTQILVMISFLRSG